MKPILLELNEIVADNIRRARKARGWNQEELGKQMQHVDIPWTRAITGYAENNMRNISVNEIAALCIVFDTVPSYWFAPALDLFRKGSPTVAIGKTRIPGEWLVATAAAGDATPSLKTESEFSAWRRFFGVLAQDFKAPRNKIFHQTLNEIKKLAG